MNFSHEQGYEEFGPGTVLDLSPALASRLLQSTSQRRFGAGQILFHAGDLADAALFVMSGRIGLRCESNSGTVVADMLGRGRPLSIYSLLSPDARHPYTAFAYTAATVRVLRRDAYQATGANNPALVSAFARSCAADAELFAQRLADGHWERAETRVRRHLVEVVERYGHLSPDGSILIDITHEELADLAGVTRPTVTLAVGAGVRSGVIHTGRGRITVPDLPSLKRWARVER